MLKDNESDFLILEKHTRRGFCGNLGCSQKYSNCNFVWKYKVYYYPASCSFKYCIYYKGKHDNFLIGESRKYYKSIVSKSHVADSLKRNSNNGKFF